MNLQQIIHQRYATKKYNPNKKIPSDQIDQLIDVLQYTPTSVNSQPYHFIVTGTPTGKQRVASSMESNFFTFNRDKVINASHSVVICSKTSIDREYLTKTIKKAYHDGRIDSLEKVEQQVNQYMSFVDLHNKVEHNAKAWMGKQCYIALGNLLLGAAALGIDATPIEGYIDFLNISTEQEYHYHNDNTAPDIKAEQEKVLWCDILIFQFPIWWFGMPAILKGWVDRVMSCGFAYATGKKYDSGIFKGRKAMICATTGTASSLYEPDGIDGDIMHLLWPIHNGIFRYLGFDVLPPYIAWMPGNVSEQEREEYLSTYRGKLLQLDQTQPLFFHTRADYGPDQRLKPDVIAKSGFQWNPKAKQTHDEAADKYTKR